MSSGILDDEGLRALEGRLGFSFTRPDLAIRALTHASARGPDRPPNERLEFLGDAIVGHIVCEYLFHRFPDMEEGQLSQLKSVLVSASVLSEVAQKLDLGRLLTVGRGLARRKNLPRSILANAFEALVAAVYLDKGLETARGLVLGLLAERIEGILLAEYGRNYKSILQDHAQRAHGRVPRYTVVQESGPDHRKSFLVEVEVGGRTFGPGRGANKKEAEQEAARMALLALGILLDEQGKSDPG